MKVKKVAWDNGCRRSLVTVQASQCCGGSAVRASDWLRAHAEPASRGRWWQPSNNRRRRAPNRKMSRYDGRSHEPSNLVWLDPSPPHPNFSLIILCLLIIPGQRNNWTACLLISVLTVLYALHALLCPPSHVPNSLQPGQPFNIWIPSTRRPLASCKKTLVVFTSPPEIHQV